LTRRELETYTKVRQRKLGIFGFALEQNVLGFQIYVISNTSMYEAWVPTSMHNTLIVQVLDCTRDCPDDVLRIPANQRFLS